MALPASPGAIEITPARFNVSCLQVGDSNTAPATRPRHSFGLSSVNEGDHAANLLRGEIEGRHLVIGTAFMDHLRDFVSGAIAADQPGLRRSGPVSPP